ncbi:MAG TPA: hypothetical protein VKY15_06750, partial [Acidimicrobiales bacterium]|nr:hypothetical protein [Acidimicrobiales bacterium]
MAPRAGRSGGFGERAPVSICGVGAVTGYGWGRKLLWDGLMSGESAVVPNEGYGEQLGMEVVWGAPVPPGGDPSDGHSRFA